MSRPTASRPGRAARTAGGVGVEADGHARRRTAAQETEVRPRRRVVRGVRGQRRLHGRPGPVDLQPEERQVRVGARVAARPRHRTRPTRRRPRPRWRWGSRPACRARSGPASRPSSSPASVRPRRRRGGQEACRRRQLPSASAPAQRRDGAADGLASHPRRLRRVDARSRWCVSSLAMTRLPVERCRCNLGSGPGSETRTPQAPS